MNYKQLTENERYQIDVMNKAGHSQKEIAELLGRSASTISRALRRNRGLRGYRPCLPQAGAALPPRRPVPDAALSPASMRAGARQGRNHRAASATTK